MRHPDPFSTRDAPSWSMHCHPLTCDSAVVDGFIQDFMNLAPAGTVQFRPLRPEVHLMRFAKPDVDASGEDLPNALGFGIPVQAFQVTDSGTKALGKGYVLPYLFVAEPWDLLMYRQRFGWGTAMGYFSWNDDKTTLTLQTIDFSPLEQAGSPALETMLELDLSPISSNPVGTHFEHGLELFDAVSGTSGAETTFNVFCLSQYRDAEVPTSACYQAITAVQVEVSSRVSSPQRSISDVQWTPLEWLPIGKNLGLTDPADKAGASVGRQETSRADDPAFQADISWVGTRTLAYGLPSGWTADLPEVPSSPSAPDGNDLSPYNTVRGGFFSRLEALPLVQNFRWLVLALPASRAALESYCANPPFGLPQGIHRFEPVTQDPFIYLALESYDQILMADGSCVSIPFHALDLMFPVDWYYRGDLLGRAFLEPFLFSDSILTVALNRWLSGFPGEWADIQETALTEENADSREDLVRLQPFGDPQPLLHVSLPPDTPRLAASPWAPRLDGALAGPFGQLLGRDQPLPFVVHKRAYDVGRDAPPPYEALVCQYVQFCEQRSRIVESPLSLRFRTAPELPLENYIDGSSLTQSADDDFLEIQIPAQQSAMFGASLSAEAGFNLLRRFAGDDWHEPPQRESDAWLQALGLQAP